MLEKLYAILVIIAGGVLIYGSFRFIWALIRIISGHPAIELPIYLDKYEVRLLNRSVTQRWSLVILISGAIVYVLYDYIP